MKKLMISALLTVASFAAAAAPVYGQLALHGLEYNNAPQGTMYLKDGPLSWPQSTSFRVGGLKAEFDDGSGFGTESFLVYCTELFAPTANFGKFKDYAKNENPALVTGGTFTSLQTSRFEKLFAKQFATTGTTASNPDAKTSAAMQLAIWEILYDETDFGDLSAGAFGFGAGDFYTNSMGGARSLAESLVSGLDSFDLTNWKVTLTSFNNGGAKPGLQDFLSARVEPGLPNPVPEPGSLALMGAGLMALGFVSRRKAKKTQ